MNSDDEQKQEWQQPAEAGTQAPYQTPVDQDIPTDDILDSRKTSPPSGLIRTASEDLLSDGGVVLATPTAEKDILDGSGEPGTAGILGESSKEQVYDDEPPEDSGDNSGDDSTPQDDEAVVRWQASEYIQHERTSVWYVVFACITLALLIIAALVIRSITFSILIPVMAAALFVYTRRPPSTMSYTLSRKGLHVNDRLYPYSEFRSFSVVSHAGYHSALLIPRKRFQLGQTVYFSEEEGEAIVDMLAARLPMQEAHPDLYDRIISKLRL